MVDEHTFTPASEPNLTNPAEVQDAIRGVKVGKAPGPNGIPNRDLKLPRSGLYPSFSRYVTRPFSRSTSQKYGKRPHDPHPETR
jgi:hypothetical protein